MGSVASVTAALFAARGAAASASAGAAAVKDTEADGGASAAAASMRAPAVVASGSGGCGDGWVRCSDGFSIVEVAAAVEHSGPPEVFAALAVGWKFCTVRVIELAIEMALWHVIVVSFGESCLVSMREGWCISCGSLVEVSST